MATISPTAPGTSVTPAAASGGGDTLALGSAQRCTLNIVNGSGSPITVTLAAVTSCNAGAGFLHNVTVSCAANKTTPINISRTDTAGTGTALCIDPATGNVGITYSAVTTVAVYAVTT